jgi:hypothetical protein
MWCKAEGETGLGCAGKGLDSPYTARCTAVRRGAGAAGPGKRNHGRARGWIRVPGFGDLVTIGTWMPECCGCCSTPIIDGMELAPVRSG